MIFYMIINEKKYASKPLYQHEAAHMLLDISLKKAAGIENYSLRRGSHGKPYLENYPEVFFNLSHCDGLAVCGVSDREIGVDCELIRHYRGNAARKIFSDREIDLVFNSDDPDEKFFRIWTLKEALGKAFGTGILSGLKKYEFSFENGAPVCKILPDKFFTQKIIYGQWIVSSCSDRPETEFEEISVFDTKHGG